MALSLLKAKHLGHSPCKSVVPPTAQKHRLQQLLPLQLFIHHGLATTPVAQRPQVQAAGGGVTQIPDRWVKVQDKEKEEARRQRRTMFTFNHWRRHRSGWRYWHHVSTLFESGIVRAIVRPVLLVTLLAAAIAAWNWAYAAKLAAAWLPPPPTIAIEPIQLTSMALSLLLVFRTNASYARWEEARRKFGAITTTSRDIARQAFSWYPAAEVGAKARLARWLVALSRASMAHLRDEHDLARELSGVLEPSEMKVLLASSHRPNFCLQVLTRLIWSARLPHELLIRLDENMSKLVEAVSSCERLLNTPVPLSYTRHTARFLMAWLAAMPLTLWPYCGWCMVPLAALISFVLLGIEEIGVYIEEPFSVMPLERLCDRLDAHISAMMREHLEIHEFMAGHGEGPAYAPGPQAGAAAGAGAHDGSSSSSGSVEAGGGLSSSDLAGVAAVAQLNLAQQGQGAPHMSGNGVAPAGAGAGGGSSYASPDFLDEQVAPSVLQQGRLNYFPS
uniref:Uncharacterized protein n=1 Tax=Chlamydomonas leiostraca TaxID=1034604 RepID=A0A7S0S469_9CHLO|mmetsp:Transcript_8041/g.20102  ORF Transcript_8041/g.20102 Transcript_8041/m.20102 type:complete len:502 (+) Transcript_8041:119-1624(+)